MDNMLPNNTDYGLRKRGHDPDLRLIDFFGEEGMGLPISLTQMRPRNSKNSNSILYSSGNQQLRVRLDLKMGGVSL